MPIIGINYERCNSCRMCVIDCTRNLFFIDSNKKVHFKDVENSCNLCGDYIAVCPENAILYDAIGEDLLTISKILETLKIIL